MSKTSAAQKELTRDPHDNDPFRKKTQMSIPGREEKDPDKEPKYESDLGRPFKEKYIRNE